MQDITAGHRASSQMLEFLSELYNASNRENEYCLTLLKLFDLYCSTGEYAKAAECLDRSAEVDPYEAGHLKRLDMLKGKDGRCPFKLIASRFSPMTKAAEEPSASGSADPGSVHAAGFDAAGGNSCAVRHAQQGGGAIATHSGNVSARRRAQRRLAAACTWPQESRRVMRGRRRCASARRRCRASRLAAPAARLQIRRPTFAALPASPKLRASSITRDHGEGGADHRGERNWRSLGNYAMRSRDGKPGLPPTAMEEFCAEGRRPRALRRWRN
jgi:hypothetical protein